MKERTSLKTRLPEVRDFSHLPLFDRLLSDGNGEDVIA